MMSFQASDSQTLAASESPGSLKPCVLDLSPGVPDSAGLEWGPRIHIAHKLPGGVNVGVGTTIWNSPWP